MKNKKKVIISIVFIVLMATIATGAYLYDIENKNNGNTTLLNTDTKTSTTTSSEDNIDWSKYQNYS